MLHEKLQALKTKEKLSIQSLSNLSGVPEATVRNVLSGKTADPGFQTVCDLVKAMHGSLDEIAGISHPPGEAQHPVIDLYERALESRSRWIKILFCVCCSLVVLMAAVVLYLIWDATHPDAGFFRY